MSPSTTNPGRLLRAVLIVGLLLPQPLLAQWNGQEELLDTQQELQDSAAPASPSRTTRSQNSIQINVFGAVTNPGTVLLPPMSRLIYAIKTAGGIKHNGSEQYVELRRAGTKTKRFSILKLKQTGDLRNNPFLQENDIVFVPFREASIIIQGPVKEPGEYEITRSTTLADVIQLALGFTTGLAHGLPVSVIRYNVHNEKTVIRVNNTETDQRNFKMLDGDIVQIPHKFTIANTFDNSVSRLPNDNISFPSYMRKVFVLGGVSKPGPYNFDPRHRLYHYVSLAGGRSRLGRHDVEIRRIDGSIEESSIRTPTPINPGDTIIVGEDKLGPEFWITFMTTLVSIGLSSYAILRR